MAPEAQQERISVPADLAEVRRLAEWLREACTRAGLGPMATIDLELAMVEAANNIVEHGAGADNGNIDLDFAMERGIAVVTLSDHGAAMPRGLYAQCRDVPTNATRGRGVGIIRSCVDVVQYESKRGRNVLRLIKLL